MNFNYFSENSRTNTDTSVSLCCIEYNSQFAWQPTSDHNHHNILLVKQRNNNSLPVTLMKTHIQENVLTSIISEMIVGLPEHSVMVSCLNYFSSGSETDNDVRLVLPQDRGKFRHPINDKTTTDKTDRYKKKVQIKMVSSFTHPHTNLYDFLLFFFL